MELYLTLYTCITLVWLIKACQLPDSTSDQHATPECTQVKNAVKGSSLHCL